MLRIGDMAPRPSGVVLRHGGGAPPAIRPRAPSVAEGSPVILSQMRLKEGHGR